MNWANIPLFLNVIGMAGWAFNFRSQWRQSKNAEELAIRAMMQTGVNDHIRQETIAMAVEIGVLESANDADMTLDRAHEVATRLRWLREQHMTGTELSDPTEETLFRIWRPAPEVAA